MGYSVLMSVYSKEKAEYLRQSIGSVFCQSVPTDDFILICDGPLSDELNEVIAQFKEEYSDIFHVFRLKKNHGLGFALNVGIKKCKHDLVARMDSDDISLPDRCEKQLKIFEKNKDVDIVSGTVEEFLKTVGDLQSKRMVPQYHGDIVEFSKKRNPFNHPCVMFKKSRVQFAGGYKSLFLLEDYYLWVRMLIKGCIGYNIPDVLLNMRIGNGMYYRRSGIKYAKAQNTLFCYMKRKGYIKRSDLFKAVCCRDLMALIPSCMRQFIYERKLRGK